MRLSDAPQPVEGLSAELRPRKALKTALARMLLVSACSGSGGGIRKAAVAMDRLDAMQVMLTAVECGSLSAASRRLGQPLATVSRKVAELESHLKADLLVRSSRGLELTPAGRSYVGAIKTILDQLDEVERAAAGEYMAPRGDLVVTAPTLFGRMHVLPIAAAFLDAFPEVSIDLMLTDRVTHFLDDHVDIAVRIGDLTDSSLIATRLGAVRRVTCASSSYLAKHSAPAVPQDLADHGVISFESVSSPTTWYYWAGEKELAVPLAARLSVSTIEAAIDAGVAGAGLIRTMCYQVVDHVRKGSLQLLLEDYEPSPRPVHLVYDRGNRLPLKLRAFVDFVVPRLRERLIDATLTPKARPRPGARHGDLL